MKKEGWEKREGKEERETETQEMTEMNCPSGGAFRGGSKKGINNKLPVALII